MRRLGLGSNELVMRELVRMLVMLVVEAVTIRRLVKWRLVLLWLLLLWWWRSLRCRVSGIGLKISSGGIACCARRIVFVLRGGKLSYTNTKPWCLASVWVV